MIEQSIILLQIIFIDIILAADNAIIIGLIAANFAPKNRKAIILWGVGGALIFKIIFAVFATYLFKFYFIIGNFHDLNFRQLSVVLIFSSILILLSYIISLLLAKYLFKPFKKLLKK